MISNLLPGPVTVVLRRNSSSLPVEFNRGNPNVGIRIAPNRFLRLVCEEMGGQPLVQVRTLQTAYFLQTSGYPKFQTSANISGAVLSPLCVEVA